MTTNGSGFTLSGRVISAFLAGLLVMICLLAPHTAFAQTGTITIVKDAVPNDPQDFQFTSNSSAIGAFALDDDSGSTVPNSMTFTVPAGTMYTITEAFTTGWTLTSINCTGGFATTTLPGRSASVLFTAGSNITCKFTNQKNGPSAQITIIKDLMPNGTQDFTFSGIGPNFNTTFKLDDDSGVSGSDNVYSNSQSWMLPAGIYNFNEHGSGPNWGLTGIDCLPASAAVIYFNSRTAKITLNAGQPVTCTFRNKPLVPPCVMQATVNIYNPMTPFSPQTVTICRGGTVKFVNVSSGIAHTINPTTPPLSFPPVSVGVNPASGTTAPFPNPGTYQYLISGGTTLQGTIIVL